MPWSSCSLYSSGCGLRALVKLNKEAVSSLLQWASVLAVGPGLGQQAWGQNLLRMVGLCLQSRILGARDAFHVALQSEDWIKGDRMTCCLCPYFQVLAQSDRPVVLDADALNLLADRVVSEPSRTNWVLTPHPGEAARLLGVSTSEVTKLSYHHAKALRPPFSCVGNAADVMLQVEWWGRLQFKPRVVKISTHIHGYPWPWPWP